MKKYAVCIHIDDIQINAVLFDMYKNCLIDESRIFCVFNHQDSPHKIIECWSITIEKILEQINPKELLGIGISIPGSFDYQEGIARFEGTNNKFQNLKGLNIDILLRKRLHLTDAIPIRIINQINALAIGESWLGKASIYPRLIAITLENSIELSFLKRGIPVNDYNKVSNHKGVNAKEYFIIPQLLSNCHNFEEKGAPLIKGSDTGIQQIFDDFGNHLGLFLSPWIKVFNAKSILIGGKIAKTWELFGAGLIQSFQNQNMHPKIILSNYEDTSIMTGCARVVTNSFWCKMVPVLEKI
jgi:glucokinase